MDNKGDVYWQLFFVILKHTAFQHSVIRAPNLLDSVSHGDKIAYRTVASKYKY